MAMRRYRIAAALPPDLRPYSIVNFPLLGAGPGFTTPVRPPGGPFSASAYIPDACISPHPRFGTLTANIRRRRGRKVLIHVPLYRDAKTRADPGGVTAITDPRFECAVPEPGTPTATVAEALGEAQSEESVEDGDALSPVASPVSPRELSGTSATDRADKACAGHTHSGASSKGSAVVVGAGASAASSASASSTPGTADDIGPAHVPRDGHIHMDAMAFGMGCCCLQVTFQARDLEESRYLYDQLAVMSPLVLALTANAPIWRGHLADTDTRWDVISASVDCRTPSERGVASSAAAAADPSEPDPSWMRDSPLASNAASGGRRRIRKSRYSSIDCYISRSSRCAEAYNDVDVQYDDEAFATLQAAGIDERLARHVAHLFIRDPLVIFSDRIHLDDAATAEHFENLQSTNWRSMRWKPPPPDASNIGWRVELRTMEAQVTDFENAAFTVFVVLLSRVMLFFDLNLYIPLSLVDENFARANRRRAASQGKFWFRRRITERTCMPAGAGAGAGAGAASAQQQQQQDGNFGCVGCGGPPSVPQATGGAGAGAGAGGGAAEEWEEMTLVEILLGKGEDFPGLVPLLHLYMDFIKCDEETWVMVDE